MSTGTGKLYLAETIKNKCKVSFISVTPSNIFSCWLYESETNIKELFECAHHYSCADIDVVCREAALTPIRRFGSATHFDNVQNQQTYGSCHRSLDHSHRYSDSQQITYPVTMEDILAAIATQNPAINRYDLLRYESFA
ncbi:unnamed protein product [Rotaria sp. Silwood1]|nr:unnamed protein product [Rotaria sp. Silwood1]CAF4973401.1 unnamed protein product [Rotaria sp. Silwood1]CAF5096686.1 unnamed protein product [Rotaria sp. Silwood1]